MPFSYTRFSEYPDGLVLRLRYCEYKLSPGGDDSAGTNPTYQPYPTYQTFYFISRRASSAHTESLSDPHSVIAA